MFRFAASVLRRHGSRVFRSVLILSALVSGLAAPAATQAVAGRVVGTVRDTSGGVLPGAALTLVQPSTNLSQSVVSDGDGNFEFSIVQPGDYELQVELDGFQPQRRPVTVPVSTTVRADFELPVAGVSTEVMVIAAPPVVRSTTSDVGEVISSQRIGQLPVNGRRFTDLVLLTNGTAVSATGTSDTPLLQTGPNLNVNGARPTHNSFAIDGVTATDYYFSNLSASTSVDAISEFKIQAGQYSAEFGGKGGGHISVVTRSGSNTIAGTVFEFLRNDALDSKNFFADQEADIPPFKQNQFGFSLGGPIVRNRMFFFANYEGSRTRETITKLATVPTEAMRNGDLSGFNTVYDPLMTTATGARSPFPGNRIPADRISNAAKLLLETVPLPNLPGTRNNYRGQGARKRDDNQVNVRADVALREADRLFVRFSSNDIDALEPFGARGTNGLPGFASSVTTKAQNAAINYTRVLTSRQVLNVLGGYNRVDGGVRTTNQALDIAGRAGIGVLDQSPANLRGVPSINTNFTTTFGDDLSNLERDNKTYQLSVQMMWNLGRHSIKYGGDLMRHRFAPYTPIFARGSYTFSGQYTASRRSGTDGNGFADFLLGYPSNAQALDGNAFEDARATWVGVFIQDDFRVNDRLTLNLGMRYDYQTPFYDTGDRLSTIDLENRRVVVASADGNYAPEANFARFGAGVPIPFVTSTEAGWPRSLVDADKTNFGPRIGGAFALTARTALRGGYSIVYSVPPLNLQARMDRNPPFAGLLQPVNTPDPTLTIETAFARAASAPSFGIVARDFRNARVQQWSIGVEQELGGGLGLSASYVGSKTDHLDWMGPGNPASPCATNCPPLESRRVYPGLGNFTITRNDARARYDALQLRASQRPWHGLNYSAALTWGKSLDNSSTSSGDDNESANNPFDLAADWGPSSFDRRVIFTFSYGYELPFGQGRRFLDRGGMLDAILGGWSLAGIITAQTGNHFSVSIANCPANVGTGCRADVNGDPNIPGGGTVQRWFDTSVFSAPAPGAYGNQGRNIVVGPGYSSTDLSLQKNFGLPRNMRLQVRVEYFNLLNRVNLNNPDRRFGAATFGVITSALPARQGQIGLKLFF